ncbi:MAG TPA: SDR family oxidoreductase [Candidatus Angelobacter sp.]|nr:SDR family oxidoreductase [Candidatus Angelobacter sp.]
MDLQLKNKKALVTGSTAGIGFAIAKSLAAEGAHVILNGRTQQRVDEAIRKIKSAHAHASATGVALDLSTAAGCEQLVKQLPSVDILVNNLGIFAIKPALEIPDADWMKFFETNVMSGVRLTRAYLPGMLKANWGRIVFISSESGINIPKEMIHYGMTKTAQIAVARGFAEETRGSGVTINTLLPGPTKSEGVFTFMEQMAKQEGKDLAAVEKDFFKFARPTSLLQRFATVDEVAAMATYLASPLASATTGAAVRVDGGVVQAAF